MNHGANGPGATNVSHAVHEYGNPAAPHDTPAPAIAGGVGMGVGMNGVDVAGRSHIEGAGFRR
ncbi:MAG: hypothetical protein ACR2RL_23905 [Gammaproteobacteria bacterium]